MNHIELTVVGDTNDGIWQKCCTKFVLESFVLVGDNSINSLRSFYLEQSQWE